MTRRPHQCHETRTIRNPKHSDALGRPARREPRSRLDEVTQFIAFLSERFKQTEVRTASALAVSPRELGLLSALVNEGPMITRALGERLGIPVSTMTGLVDRTERRGLVRRRRAGRDRRAIELVATATGTRALREHTRDLEAIARGMLRALSEREQSSLIAILRRIRGRIEGRSS